MTDRLVEYSNKIQELLADKRATERAYKANEDRRLSAVKDAEDIETASAILQAVGKAVQEKLHRRLSGVVSRCLSAVFEDPYSLLIKFVNKRGRTEAEIVFVRDGQEVDPMTASGGGVVDVAAFALRIACICMSYPKSRRLVVLDEPFRFLSEGYRDAGRQILETLATEMQCQFLVVTHIPQLSTGEVVELKKST